MNFTPAAVSMLPAIPSLVALGAFFALVGDMFKPLFSIFMKLFDRRSQFYYDNFGSKYKKYFNPGSNGFDSVIIAYDCLLDCKGSFETLIYYSMLHAGDSDSTGCIAGAFYGAYYGKFDLPKNLYNIEFYDKMKKLVDKI